MNSRVKYRVTTKNHNNLKRHISDNIAVIILNAILQESINFYGFNHINTVIHYGFVASHQRSKNCPVVQMRYHN